MIRYASNPPNHYAPPHDQITSPHLYTHRRSTSTVFRPATSTTWPLHQLRRLKKCARTYRYLTLTNLLRLFWLVLVFWGERHVWSTSFAACDWDTWERWPAGATPHRLALLADPQLVDLHTYARRGLPLAATIYYTDKYLGRAWRGLHDTLAPSDVYFLGDLFDGGREWAVSSRPKSAAEAAIAADPNAPADWAMHGNEYWLAEFARWERIFGAPPGVRIRRGIPGNHDLGFGGGVRESVRGRFNAFFGESNARWQVGNHTFVSIDAVSLSNDKDPVIYGPGREFIDSLDLYPNPHKQWPHVVEEVGAVVAAPLRVPASTSLPLPTVLLTHVPLYRQKDTPCGPHRERGTSIPIWQGYQYQNVLSPALSSELLKKTRARYVFSGDDHDACDVTHMYGPQGRVREWTVKSVSWTMGVRRPAFELVSLWNPLTDAPAEPTADTAEMPAHIAETPEQLTARLGPAEERDPTLEVPKPAEVRGGADTLQAKLCFLPDQIGIFFVYAFWGAASVLALIAEVWWTRKQRRERRIDAAAGAVLLPTVEPGWKGFPDSEREEADGGEGKYWKPRPKVALGRWWWAREVAFEVGGVAAVALGFYAVLLQRW